MYRCSTAGWLGSVGIGNELHGQKIMTTRILCMKVRPRPIRDGLDAVLRGLLAVLF